MNQTGKKFEGVIKNGRHWFDGDRHWDLLFKNAQRV